jgi:putative SOS response-associated peptidase YedK
MPTKYRSFTHRADTDNGKTMCGRINLRVPLTVLIEQFEAEVHGDPQQLLFEPRYNIPPTQDIWVVRRQAIAPKRELVSMRWGLLPSWTKDPKKAPLLNNARAETVADKPSFRSAFKSRRCLIPASGFVEWKREGKVKQPYYFRRPDDKPMAFAGLWETWNDIESCTIITTDANERMSQIHDRTPVVLSQNDYATWLDPSATELTKPLTPCPPDELVYYPVNPIVNNARNEGPECIAS